MANSDAATPSKPGKPASAVQEQSSINPYPDWTAMQAYYGSGVAMPPPYFATNVTPSHSPHPYMWPSPLMMSPFGAPYSMYPPAGVYAQPPDAIEGNAAVISSTEAKAGGVVAPIKSPMNKDARRSNGLSASACNGGDENELGSVADVTSQSESDGRDSCNGSKKQNGYHTLENQVSQENGTRLAATANPSLPVQVRAGERESKKEKRKQSNRESARRSRLRKQAEAEELSQKVEILVAENQALRSEISQLSKDSARLRLENSVLQEKLREVQLDTESGNPASAITENLLSRISSSAFSSRIEEREKERK